MVEGKGHSIVDRGKEMLFSDQVIKEVSSLKLGDYRTCGQGGDADLSTTRTPSAQASLEPTLWLLTKNPVILCVLCLHPEDTAEHQMFCYLSQHYSLEKRFLTKPEALFWLG